jgi:hypothetical protein
MILCRTITCVLATHADNRSADIIAQLTNKIDRAACDWRVSVSAATNDRPASRACLLAIIASGETCRRSPVTAMPTVPAMRVWVPMPAPVAMPVHLCRRLHGSVLPDGGRRAGARQRHRLRGRRSHCEHSTDRCDAQKLGHSHELLRSLEVSRRTSCSLIFQLIRRGADRSLNERREWE